jgi:hypothetical protein
MALSDVASVAPPQPMMTANPMLAPPGAPPPAPTPQGVPYPGPAGGAAAGSPPSGNYFTPAQLYAIAHQGGTAASPGGFVPSSRATQVQQGVPVSEDTRAMMADASRDAKIQAAAGGSLEIQKAEDAAGKAAALATLDQQQEKMKQARWDDQAQQLAGYHNDLQGALAEASKPDDPHKWWHDKSGFQKVATGLQMMLQGFQFGSTGRGESPNKWIEDQIKESVTQQRATKDADVKAKSAGYNLLKDKLGDDERTHVASEMAHRQTIISWLDQKASDAQLLPQARFAAAKLGGDLMQNQAKQQIELDDKTADKITRHEAETYRAPTAGGTPDALTLLRREAEASKLGNQIGGVGPEADKARLEQRKGEADVKKTEAEAAKLEGEAGGGAGAATLQDLGGKVKSTNWEFLTRGIQGTSSHDAALQQQQWNSTIKGLVHKKFGARSPEAMESVGAPWLIKPGDSADTVRQKVAAAKAQLANLADAPPGVDTGVAPE